MKIKVRKLFRYQADARTTKELKPGIYNVGSDISKSVCDMLLSLSAAEVYVAPVFKKAPEKKVVLEAPENKTSVAKPALRSGGSRTKPNKRTNKTD